LVEDDLVWQSIVTNVLDQTGSTYRIATNAQEALAHLDQEPFHLIILDLQFHPDSETPGLPLRSDQGWTLLNMVVQERPSQKVIILTGRTTRDETIDLLKHYPNIIDLIDKVTFLDQTLLNALLRVSGIPTLSIQTFGSFQLWRDDQPIIWERHQAETVAKLLLVTRARGRRSLTTDELMDYLWPHSNADQQHKNLRPLIYSARHTLEPAIPPRESHFIQRIDNAYSFDLAGPVHWDLLDFRRHLNRGRMLAQQKNWDEAIVELEHSRALYKGDFLCEDLHTDWATDIRRELITDLCALLTILADAYAARKRYDRAIEICTIALRKDPLLESACRQLMRFYCCNGEKAQALKTYYDFVTIFREAFDTEDDPDPVTCELYEAIRRDDLIEC
jgi:DNA-binding SARP family transcriptional activator/CheY-like chemotaxis protein